MLARELNARLFEKCSRSQPNAAAMAGTVQELLAAGADLGATDSWGRTPLEVAVAAGNGSAVRELLGSGAPPDTRDILGYPVWLSAVLDEEWEVVLAFAAQGVRFKGVYDPQQRRIAALSYVAVRAPLKVLAALLRAGADPNYRHSSAARSAVHAVCAEGGAEALKLLLDHGGSPRTPTAYPAKSPAELVAKHRPEAQEKLQLLAEAAGGQE